MPLSILQPELFTRRNPAYDGLLKHWDFCEATYRGGRAWFAENVHRYMREGDREFADRVTRAYRFNHTREVVDLITKYIFKVDILRKTEDAPEEIKEFWKNATKGKGTIDDLMREASKMTSVYGQPYVVVDSTIVLPEGEEKSKLSVADAKKIKGRVFAYIVRPQDALDMSYDDEGVLNWILFRERAREDKEFFSDQETYIRYRLWTRDKWYLYRVREATPAELAAMQQKVRVGGLIARFTPSSHSAASQTTEKMVVEEVGSGTHDLGVVPVVPIRDRDGDSFYSAPALIDDIAYLDRATANYLSNLDAIIQDQTFSVLTIPVQSVPDSADGHNKLIELGTKRIFAYDSEGGAGPEFISPDPSQAQIILAVVTKIITEIYHSVGMAGERTKMDNAAGIDNSSGVAKAYDFDRMNTMLKSKADRLQDTENKIVSLVMGWNGTPDYDTQLVTYNDDFDVRNLYDEFDVANRLTLLAAPLSLRRHQIEMLVKKLYPNLSDKLIGAIKKEIDEWGEVEEEEVGLTTAPSKLQDRKIPKKDKEQGQNNS